MKQMIKETALEVKREIPVKSQRKDKFEVPAWLLGKSNEACYELLSKVGRIEHYPASFLTHPEEMMRFFGIEHHLWSSFYLSFKSMVERYNFYGYYPKVDFQSFASQVKKQADMMGVPCNETIDAEGNHFFSRDENPQHVVRLGNPSRCHRGVRLATMKGVLIMAFYLEKNPKYATKTTRKIVQYCYELGFNTTKISAEDIFPLAAEPAKESESVPADPAPESPKMDYAETLRKLFDSVLTLVEKQAEERGAEKIVQQLKDAGKL